MIWFRRKKPLPPAAAAALAAAERSQRQSKEDLARITRKLAESRKVADRLRAHNAANHFDELLMRVMTGGNP